jgi:hypothetical protein
MRSKKKVYQAKPILDGDDAVRYLAELIGNPLTPEDFVELATAHHLPAFIEVDEIDYTAQEVETDNQFHPAGLCEVVQELQAHMQGSKGSGGFGEPDPYYISLININYEPCLIYKGQNDKGETVEMDIIGEVDGEFAEDSDGYFSAYNEPLLFKPADIRALADKLNGKPTFEVQREELTALRDRVQELEKENAELKAHGAIAGGLSFPYSTPDLEAMQKAAVRYWVKRSEGKQKPTQKAIAITITETLGAELTAEMKPPRKAVEYAIAIQPKQYREA